MIEFTRRMTGNGRARRLVLVLLAAFVGAPVAKGAGWWNLRYRYRREVRLKAVQPTGLPGDDIAVVTMPTGGFGAPDGSDFRVTTDAGREVPSRVLMMGPGDQARIAFAVSPRAGAYHVYFGSDRPGPRKGLDVRRGVLHEVWAYAGGPVKQFGQVQELLAKPGRLLGRRFENGMFLGYNPFGPSTRILSVYTGYFVVKEAVTCELACTAVGSSFLHVDDELVFSAVGRRHLERRIRRGGKVELSPGLHRLTLHHVCPGGDVTTLVAWREQGWKHFRLFPQGLFTPVARAAPGAMRKYGLAADVDYIPAHAGEAFVKGRYLQRYSFQALAVGKAPSGPAWKWDFGDGVTSTGRTIEHVFLKPGWYDVTLTGKTAIGQLQRRNRIYVSRPWDKVTHSRIDSIKAYARLVEKYDLDALRTDLLAQAALLFERADMEDAVLRAGTAFIKRRQVEPADVRAVLPLFAQALLARSQPMVAAKALLRGVEMTQDAEVQAELFVRAGRIHLDHTGQMDQAMKLFEQAAESSRDRLNAAWRRRARFGIADVHRARGSYDKAQAAYAQLEDSGAAPARAALKRGDFAMHVESYIREKDFTAAEEHLQEWQRRFPRDKLEGYWSLLRARLAAARGQHRLAAREAEILVRVNPRSNYAAPLLMVAAEAYARLNQTKEAREALRRIVQDYPESVVAATASQELER